MWIALLAWTLSGCGLFESAPSGPGVLPPMPAVVGPDGDNDGLSDADEARLGTDPALPDSDGDGKSDGVEVHQLRTDPLKTDSDGDGVGDGAELRLGTDPTVPDHTPAPVPDHMRPGPDGDPNQTKGQRAPGAGEPEPPPSLRCPDNERGGLECFRPVAAGAFLRGAQASDPSKPNYDGESLPDEGPVSKVEVSAFWMMQYEVTVSIFARCVQAGFCTASDVEESGGFSMWAAHQQGRARNEAINGITWDGAKRVCTWLGGRLPTETEWEYAARGPEARRFPWGDAMGCGVLKKRPPAVDGRAPPREMVTGPCEQLGVVAPSDLLGESPFGLMAMAGNVWEWTSDVYAPDGYAGGKGNGATRVQRGGGWTSTDPVELRSAARGSAPPDTKLNDVGVRCAWGPTPTP